MRHYRDWRGACHKGFFGPGGSRRDTADAEGCFANGLDLRVA